MWPALIRIDARSMGIRCIVEFLERPLHGTKHIELRGRGEFPAVGASIPRRSSKVSSKEHLIVGVFLALLLFDQVQNQIAYSRLAVCLKIGGRGLERTLIVREVFVRKATAAAEEKKSDSDAYDYLVRKTSELINKTILGRFEKMYREFKDSPVPLQQEDLSFMTGRVNQYELNARDAVESMHEAATGYNSTYRPQVENAEKKIKTACTKIRNAVAEAQLKLKNKRSKLSTHEPTVSHASHGAMSSLSPLNPLSPWQGALGDDAAAQVLQRAHREALAASQRELVAQQEKVDVQNKAAADLRRSEERLRDAERKSAETVEKAAVERRNAEAQALTEWKKALLKTSQDIAMHTALEEQQAKAKQYSAAEKTVAEKESMLAIL